MWNPHKKLIIESVLFSFCAILKSKSSEMEIRPAVYFFYIPHLHAMLRTTYPKIWKLKPCAKGAKDAQLMKKC